MQINSDAYWPHGHLTLQSACTNATENKAQGQTQFSSNHKIGISS